MKKLLLLLFVILICCVSCTTESLPNADVCIFYEDSIDSTGLASHVDIKKSIQKEIRTDVKTEEYIEFLNTDYIGEYESTVINQSADLTFNRYRLKNVTPLNEDYPAFVDFDTETSRMVKINGFKICDFIEVNEETSREVVETAVKDCFGDTFNFEMYNYFEIMKSTSSRYVCWWGCQYNGLTSTIGIVIVIDNNSIVQVANYELPYEDENDYTFDLDESEVNEVIANKLSDICSDLGYVYVSHEINDFYLTQYKGKKSLYCSVDLDFKHGSGDSDSVFGMLLDVIVSEDQS